MKERGTLSSCRRPTMPQTRPTCFRLIGRNLRGIDLQRQHLDRQLPASPNEFLASQNLRTPLPAPHVVAAALAENSCNARSKLEDTVELIPFLSVGS